MEITAIQFSGEPIKAKFYRDGRISSEPSGETEFELTIEGVALDEELAVVDLLRHDRPSQFSSLLALLVSGLDADSPIAGSDRLRIRLSTKVAMPGSTEQVVIVPTGHHAQTVVECEVIAPSGELVRVHLPLIFTAEVV